MVDSINNITNAGGSDLSLGTLEEMMNKSLQNQLQMTALQMQYQDQKAAIDYVSNVMNSEHSAEKDVAEKVGQS